MNAVVLLVYLAIVVLWVVGLWVVFTKAGEPGWAAIIPIYNLIVLLKITGKPVWWVILMFIPLVNYIILLLVSLAMARVFNKGSGFGVGLWLLPFVFYPMLAFSDAQYAGPEAAA
ncbi:MAG: DUF5684 domain-containing protein [Candidatus Lernaella stagnicola]|nr:DUF5684 domain-containing protein [Candidatus Lernaella stagnicola]